MNQLCPPDYDDGFVISWIIATVVRDLASFLRWTVGGHHPAEIGFLLLSLAFLNVSTF
jgi:hypothetical protein